MPAIDQPCRVPGCDLPSNCRGLCKSHYDRSRNPANADIRAYLLPPTGLGRGRKRRDPAPEAPAPGRSLRRTPLTPPVTAADLLAPGPKPVDVSVVPSAAERIKMALGLSIHADAGDVAAAAEALAKVAHERWAKLEERTSQLWVALGSPGTATEWDDLLRAADSLHKRVDELQDAARFSPNAAGRDAGPRTLPRLALLDTRGRVVAEVHGTCRLDVSSYRHLVEHVVVEEVERG